MMLVDKMCFLILSYMFWSPHQILGNIKLRPEGGLARPYIAVIFQRKDNYNMHLRAVICFTILYKSTPNLCYLTFYLFKLYQFTAVSHTNREVGQLPVTLVFKWPSSLQNPCRWVGVLSDMLKYPSCASGHFWKPDGN